MVDKTCLAVLGDPSDEVGTMGGEEKFVAGTSGEISQVEEDRILTRLAVGHKLLSEEQIQEALSFQRHERDQGNDLALGEILVRKGMLSAKQHEALKRTGRLVHLRKPDQGLAKLVVRNGFTTEEEVKRATDYQAKLYKQTGLFKNLGDLLVELGIITVQQRSALTRAMERFQQKSTGHQATIPCQDTRRDSRRDSASECKEQVTCLARDSWFDLLVTESRLKAYLRIKQAVPETMDVRGIKDRLESEGILYGIAADTLIENYVKHKGGEGCLWRIAEGLPPKPGQSAVVKYHFPPRAESASESAAVDGAVFKERRQPARVEQGELIAEISPAVMGTSGMDVYGKPIENDQPGDVEFLCGPGVEVSEDGQRMFAKISGIPQLSVYGRVSVVPDLVIEGDVGLETGNVTFDGYIVVRGVVQDGFTVKGAALRAQEIAKARIDVTGDVIVFGGILGASIKSRGTVEAVHVHASRIEALGDVIVKRGIVDSNIILSGKCVTPKGKLLSSSITAKEGIEALQIGSERSRPCSVVIGVDLLAKREIETLKEAASKKLQGKAKYEEMIEELERDGSRMEQGIGELAQAQDRMMREHRALVSELDELKRRADPAKLSQVETRLKEIESSMASSEEELNKLFERQDQAKDKTTECREKIREIEAKREEIHEELAAISEWASRETGNSAIKVFGTIFSGTEVKGTVASLVLQENARGVAIREQKPAGAEGRKGSASRAEITIEAL